ncbi:YwqG family protein [Kitasatospora sp. NPDC050543]|uniref:YwqG family protein n=1 Tax=Kitasatospora sp. NPDC050543 TaxID=3364054 RepID=UPI0037886902
MTSWNSGLSDLAHQHLPPAVAERWIGVLRPAARLAVAPAASTAPDATAPDATASAANGAAEAGVEQAGAGQLGGLPELPPGVPWPQWPGHGPLTFIASVDCAALPHGELDLELPTGGTLLFFYFDGQLDGGQALVIYSDQESQAGARVLYVPAGVETVERPLPDGLTAYPRLPLTAQPEATAPEYDEPALAAAFGTEGQDPEHMLDHPVCGEDFTAAVHAARPGPRHRIGGFPHPVQGSVQYEAARAALGPGTQWDDPRVRAMADRLVLLAQIDSDYRARMMWGDMGVLYWLISPEDLAARRFDKALFTWQCC